MSQVIPYIKANELVVGKDHPTEEDTLNRAVRAVVSASGMNPDAAFTGFGALTDTPSSVLSTADRDTKFPSPTNNKVVLRLDTGNYEKWNAATGVWDILVERPREWLNPKTQGAAFDGSTDDTAKIQAHFDLLSNATNTTGNKGTTLPFGDCCIYNTIVIKTRASNFWVKGHGAYSTRFIWKGTAGKPMFKFVGARTVVWEDLGLVGNSSANPSALIELSMQEDALPAGNAGAMHCVFNRMHLGGGQGQLMADAGILFSADVKVLDSGRSISAVGANYIDVSGTPWVNGQFIGLQMPVSVRILTGPGAGQEYPIQSNTTNRVTIATYNWQVLPTTGSTFDIVSRFDANNEQAEIHDIEISGVRRGIHFSHSNSLLHQVSKVVGGGCWALISNVGRPLCALDTANLTVSAYQNATLTVQANTDVWTLNQYAGRECYVVVGGVYQRFYIIGNSAKSSGGTGTVTVNKSFVPVPSAGDTFRIFGVATNYLVSSTQQATITLSGTHVTDGQKNRYIWINTGSGAGQRSKILSNTNTGVMTLERSFYRALNSPRASTAVIQTPAVLGGGNFTARGIFGNQNAMTFEIAGTRYPLLLNDITCETDDYFLYTPFSIDSWPSAVYVDTATYNAKQPGLAVQQAITPPLFDVDENGGIYFNDDYSFDPSLRRLSLRNVQYRGNGTISEFPGVGAIELENSNIGPIYSNSRINVLGGFQSFITRPEPNSRIVNPRPSPWAAPFSTFKDVTNTKVIDVRASEMSGGLLALTASSSATVTEIVGGTAGQTLTLYFPSNPQNVTVAQDSPGNIQLSSSFGGGGGVTPAQGAFVTLICLREPGNGDNGQWLEIGRSSPSLATLERTGATKGDLAYFNGNYWDRLAAPGAAQRGFVPALDTSANLGWYDAGLCTWVWDTIGTQSGTSREVQGHGATLNGGSTSAGDITGTELEIIVSNSSTDPTPSGTATLSAATASPLGTVLKGSGTATLVMRSGFGPSNSPGINIKVTEPTATVTRYLWVKQGPNSKSFVRAGAGPLAVSFA